MLITGHRRENFGGGFEAICAAIRELARRFPDVAFVYPVHLNPNVREPVRRMLGARRRGGNVHLIDPLGYLEFVALMDRSTLILTDSGGVQEEAPSLGKPVLLMREDDRAARGDRGRHRPARRQRRVDDRRRGGPPADRPRRLPRHDPRPNPYGDGHAAGRIVALCKDLLASRRARARVRTLSRRAFGSSASPTFGGRGVRTSPLHLARESGDVGTERCRERDGPSPAEPSARRPLPLRGRGAELHLRTSPAKAERSAPKGPGARPDPLPPSLRLVGLSHLRWARRRSSPLHLARESGRGRHR